MNEFKTLLEGKYNEVAAFATDCIVCGETITISDTYFECDITETVKKED